MKQVRRVLAMLLVIVMIANTGSIQNVAAMEETAASDFTYKVLNGTYCEITGYIGDGGYDSS